MAEAETEWTSQQETVGSQHDGETSGHQEEECNNLPEEQASE